jgi:hypothetical protein
MKWAVGIRRWTGAGAVAVETDDAAGATGFLGATGGLG